MQLTWARWAPMARAQACGHGGRRECGPTGQHRRPSTARQAALPPPLTHGELRQRRKARVRVAASAGGADMSGSAALLGLLLSFASYGATTAVKDVLDARRERELLARAKARHRAFVQSGEADEADEEWAVAALELGGDKEEEAVVAVLEGPARQQAADASVEGVGATAARLPQLGVVGVVTGETGTHTEVSAVDVREEHERISSSDGAGDALAPFLKASQGRRSDWGAGVDAVAAPTGQMIQHDGDMAHDLRSKLGSMTADSSKAESACEAGDTKVAPAGEVFMTAEALKPIGTSDHVNGGNNSPKVEAAGGVSLGDSLKSVSTSVHVNGGTSTSEVDAARGVAVGGSDNAMKGGPDVGEVDAVGGLETGGCERAIYSPASATDAPGKEEQVGLKTCVSSAVAPADNIGDTKMEASAVSIPEVIEDANGLNEEEGLDGGSYALSENEAWSPETADVLGATTATEAVASAKVDTFDANSAPSSAVRRTTESPGGEHDSVVDGAEEGSAEVTGIDEDCHATNGDPTTEWSADMTELDSGDQAAGIQILQAMTASSIDNSSGSSLMEEEEVDGAVDNASTSIAAEAVQHATSVSAAAAVEPKAVEAAPVAESRRASGSRPLEFGSTNGGSTSPNDHALELHYYTGWERAMVHGSVAGAAWESYSTKKGKLDGWQSFTCDARANEGTPLLEFVMTNNEKSDWDKPMDGSNYIIQEPGVYTLRDGVLSKCPPVPLFMVVSDLDGTMVGNDDSTASFKKYWESGPVLMGCRLVYSTGRSLELFLQLAKEKAGILAKPDILILGVGTEVYYRGKGDEYVKDKTWSQVLDKGWNLQVVRDAAYAALAEVGKDSMHFRPPSEQNDHKVTCGVRTEELERVVAIIKRKIEGCKVEANIISSGQGDWRYLDIVSNQAGKLESLEYVAQAEGFPLDRTVACGDSGNDILMLAGKNRAIVVGNAQDDLRKWVERNPEAVTAGEDGRSRLRVTEAREAKGILEGLQYFGFRE